jgi:hypothetical protein
VDGLDEYTDGRALVAVDVIRATTTAVTAISMGRECHLVPTLQAAFDTASRLPNVLLAGELGGEMIPLGTLVRLREINGPVSVQRYNLYVSAAVITALVVSVATPAPAGADPIPGDQPLPGYTINNPPLTPALVGGVQGLADPVPGAPVVARLEEVGARVVVLVARGREIAGGGIVR